MKQAHWTIAAIVLAVMVFGLTFFGNYLGDNATTPTGGGTAIKPALELDFPLGKLAPEDGLSRLEQEEHVAGHQDFWYVNRNSEPVTVGLNLTNCACSEVEAFLLPEDRAAEVKKLLAGADRPPPWGHLNVAAVARAPALEALKLGLKGTPLKRDGASLAVPPDAIGFARLHWSGEKRLPKLEAKLWMGTPGNTKDATLEVAILLFEPVRFKLDEADAPILNDEELQKGATRTIYAWSSTRTNFQLEARLVSAVAAASDPVTIGKPEPLTAEELRKLQDDNNTSQSRDPQALAGPVRSGYRIKVQLNAWSADKTPFPIGPFARRVVLTSRDALREDKSVLIRGRVEGLIDVSGPGVEAGAINFGPFKRSAGRKLVVRVTSELEGLDLVVEPTRTSKFLRASVRKEARRSRDDAQRWALTVEVLPNQARGEFPRAEAGYEESGVYLKATQAGKPARTVRVGVQGIASEE